MILHSVIDPRLLVYFRLTPTSASYFPVVADGGHFVLEVCGGRGHPDELFGAFIGPLREYVYSRSGRSRRPARVVEVK